MTMRLRTSDQRALRWAHRASEDAVLEPLLAIHAPDVGTRQRIQERALHLVDQLRNHSRPSMMEQFLGEYGLSTNEGIALMCMAEALLRVPDPGTMDELIEDKIVPYEWERHLGKSASSLVNASTAALMLSGRVLDDDNSASVLGLLNRTIRRLGEPVVRIAVRRAMQEMGDQFVLGQTIDEAIQRGAQARQRGYLYSYDMLGEAALTEAAADDYFAAYHEAITRVGATVDTNRIQDGPGVSIKLSALHPRFEFSKRQRLERELVARLKTLALAARDQGLGLNIDAEEAARLEITLEVLQAVLSDPALSDWEGLGLVVQAYGKRAGPTVDWLYHQAVTHRRRVMLRLVKGAYWDTEIKIAQVSGVSDYPVFVRRAATDASYICTAHKLLGMTDRIYPQFATHNAHTVAALLELGGDPSRYEFQRLHGMGETLHNLLIEEHGLRSRIYAPVGPHEDLLAYLVRRLLENGANSSFVNQLADPNLPAEQIIEDPFAKLEAQGRPAELPIGSPDALYAPDRRSAPGWDLANAADVEAIEQLREPFVGHFWTAAPLLAVPADAAADRPVEVIQNPAQPEDEVGSVGLVTEAEIAQSVDAAVPWATSAPTRIRAAVLIEAARLFEINAGELLALLAREAGKTQADGIAEVREAIDFLRYYAGRCLTAPNSTPLGTVSCISPWNFPLAIFTGQISAALAQGNAVLAKPAEATPLIAYRAVQLLHRAGVPRASLQLLPGPGATVGQAVTASAAVDGVCFTGSTATAQHIHRSMAARLAPAAPLIAETGGINAAIVDSTALPERAVHEIITSAYQSAGQRCSALRVLYVQEDIFEPFVALLTGAMQQFSIGVPWDLATDIGPVISAAARDEIQGYVDAARAEGRLLLQLRAPATGHFVAPALIAVEGIAAVEREIFGPVLHLARFAADDFEQVLEDINATGFGLTFGLHTRIDERAEMVSNRLRVGNVYINRNQVGAVVESQPFGGEGLSGTGPKAGGPSYLPRFAKPRRPAPASAAMPAATAGVAPVASVQQTLHALAAGFDPKPLSKQVMTGPTGEDNTLRQWPRGTVLCLGPTPDAALAQAAVARRNGCPALCVVPGIHSPEGSVTTVDGLLARAALTELTDVAIVALWDSGDDARSARQALAARTGALLPLVTHGDFDSYCIVERHSSVDTTAAGGNASLLSGHSV
ncbi:MAG: bifunctional proline dehydrogenase/L-glutamate gamma-semialdehyde dehydrogenase PutA [Pseudomonadota bacterium]